MPSIKVPTLQGDPSDKASEDPAEAASETETTADAVVTRPRNIDPAAKRLFDQSLTRIEQDDLPAARLLLTELTSLYPNIPEAHYNLGQVLEQLDESDLATIAYQAAINADRGFCPAQIRLALIARLGYEFETAEMAYQQCLDQHPDNATAQFNLGVLYEIYLGRYEDAVNAYEQFQSQQAERDRRVDLWINDLKRRMPTPPAQDDTGTSTVQNAKTVATEEVDNDQT
ncbi:MAG: tetratricopeptide repeat protein [Pseudomonadota bacterium]